jgi:hypothetical protein
MAKQKEEGSGEWEDKAENAWSYYTAQAQEIGRKALQSKDDALKTAKSQLGQLQDASSHHLTTAQVCKFEHSHSHDIVVGEKSFAHKKKKPFLLSRNLSVLYDLEEKQINAVLLTVAVGESAMLPLSTTLADLLFCFCKSS